MIPSQTFETYPIFGGNATKVEPGDAKKSAGFQQADVLPAEWMNWAWNKNSKGISDLNEGVTSLEKEVNNVLAEAHISPSSDTNVNNQLFKAVQKNNGCIITDAATPAVITNAPAIEAGNMVKVMFGADVTGGNTTTAMLISYNGSNITVKVNKNGAKANFVATEVSSGTYKYLQAYTTLELVYDGVDFLIVGNPVVLSGSNYTVYADGLKRVDSITNGDNNLPTANAVYNFTKYEDFIVNLGSVLYQGWYYGVKDIPIARSKIIAVSVIGSSSNIPAFATLVNNSNTQIEAFGSVTGNDVYVRVFYYN